MREIEELERELAALPDLEMSRDLAESLEASRYGCDSERSSPTASCKPIKVFSEVQDLLKESGHQLS